MRNEPETEQQKQQRRETVWYDRYHRLAWSLRKSGLDHDTTIFLLKRVDRVLNDARGYHYQHIASSAWKSMLLAVEDVYSEPWESETVKNQE